MLPILPSYIPYIAERANALTSRHIHGNFHFIISNVLSHWPIFCPLFGLALRAATTCVQTSMERLTPCQVLYGWVDKCVRACVCLCV